MYYNVFAPFAAAMLMAGAVACSGGSDSPEPAPSAVAASVETIDFDTEGGTKTFTVTANGEWDAATTDAWLRLAKTGTTSTSGSVELTAAANPDRKERTGSITLMSGSARATVSVTQAGKAAQPVDPTITVPEGYELVWNDEFDGAALDAASWTHEVQGPGWVNNELQTYVNGSFNGSPVTEVSNGTLKINCFKQAGKVYSGRIYANVKSGWKYGIFEARIKLPKGRGTWPAYWMMPVTVDWANEGWPRCGEIDIMEEVGYNPDYTSSSIHCDAYNHVKGTQKTAERLTRGAQEDFHIYRLEWTEDYIRTYVDDVRLLSFNNDKTGNVATWPFSKPFYLILNLAWGGDWGGAQGVDESVLPATMEVDYVRIFQKTAN